MKIPAFQLPSNPKKIINFRTPTVQDALNFCELNPSLDESSTTSYLNDLQDIKAGESNHDSGYWTGEDRRTALWWIFISSQTDTTVTYSTICSHCKGTVYHDINLVDLGGNAVILQKEPKKEIKFESNNQSYSAVIKPLTGYALEHIEQLRIIRNECKTEKEKRKLSNEMAITELAHSLNDVTDQPKGNNESFEYKKQLISSMAMDSEFRPLIAMVELSLREMRHGLLTKYMDGTFHLICSVDGCPCNKNESEAQEGNSLLLLLPFRSFDFISTL